MNKNLQDISDKLVTMLSDQGYSEECLACAKDLAGRIAEYDAENPENVPSVRLTKDSKEPADMENENDQEGEVEGEDTDEVEKITPDEVKSIKDKPISETKDMLKKKKIILTIE